ncbi:MAG: nitroreductase family protein [Candidatus Bathyarchaeia archaeon]
MQFVNEAIEVIKCRRSIRKFKPEQIPDHMLREILECALLAPNARNQQKWHFTVIQNKEVLKKMVEIMKENMLNLGIDFLAERARDPNFNPFWNAPTVILITVDKTAHFAEIDCALAAENILIVAESLGLGSLIMTSTEFLFISEKGKELKKELGVPEGCEHVCVVALGYKNENPPTKLRRKDAINYIR